MNVRPNYSTLVAKCFLLLFVFMVIGIFLLQAPLVPSSARGQERVFEDTTPKNAPIKLKIKAEKERSFKDLTNEKWVEEFELEVVNTSDKPIYFLHLMLTSDVKIGNSPLVFPLTYGRAELGDIITKAGPDDVPIKPGETYVFKIHPGQVPAWEYELRKKTHPDATRIRTNIQMVSFGDGTGYFVNKPYPGAPISLTIRRKQIDKNGGGFS
jgi:hypothetical protein